MFSFFLNWVPQWFPHLPPWVLCVTCENCLGNTQCDFAAQEDLPSGCSACHSQRLWKEVEECLEFILSWVCNCGEQRLAIWLLSSVILKTPGVGHQRNQYPETQIPLCLLCVLLSWCLWDMRISAGRSGIFPCTVQFVFGPSPQTTPSLRLLKLTVFWSAALQLLFGCDKLQDHVLFF